MVFNLVLQFLCTYIHRNLHTFGCYGTAMARRAVLRRRGERRGPPRPDRAAELTEMTMVSVCAVLLNAVSLHFLPCWEPLRTVSLMNDPFCGMSRGSDPPRTPPHPHLLKGTPRNYHIRGLGAGMSQCTPPGAVMCVAPRGRVVCILAGQGSFLSGLNLCVGAACHGM